ncbi:CAP domain-containing protein [Actinoplanes sp. NPDC051851]|uniref:CAP domain-containing protein n=1 Tax=Actinoplanes sp. NPDC051851 TaxID=3154753 RepID=UPI0034167331
MRKTLIVLGAAVAVLVSGGIAAGHANAEEPPDPAGRMAAPVSAYDAISAVPASPVQRQVLTLVNKARQRAGCRAVTIDRRLVLAASRHAADMARRNYFEHDSRDGDDVGDRVSDAGYRWRKYGENIARGQRTAGEAMRGWMTSPPHRRNILDCGLKEMGVGLALSTNHTAYWVQDLATPM